MRKKIHFWLTKSIFTRELHIGSKTRSNEQNKLW